jgi:hypothetical protein
MLQQGQGKTIAGRKQLEGYSTPHDYLRTLSTPTYQGETGWAIEDFLTNFIIQLEMTNQVSHDRYDSNALWLLGSYVPNSGFSLRSDSGRAWGVRNLVPVGYWARVRMEINAHRSANRLKGWVARSMVRLGTY